MLAVKTASKFILLVVVSTIAGQIALSDTALTDKVNYKGIIFIGRGGYFTNLGASIRMKPPAFFKEYDADPFLSIAYLYGTNIYKNDEYYFEGLTIALELHRQINTGIESLDMVTFIGAGLPIAGGAPDPDEEQPSGLDYFLTGGLKVQRSIIELNVRVGLLRSWPLPKPTPYLTLNAGMRTNSLLFPLGDIFRRKSKIVDQTSKDTRYRWGSSFGGAFFEDKFNHLETVKVFYRLPEPLFFNRPGISQCFALGFLRGEYFPDEDGLISYTNTLYYSMTTFHKYIINTSTIVPIRFSVSAGGGFGHSTTINRNEQGPTIEMVDYRGVGYLLTTGGRLEIGSYYCETNWDIRDADPHLLNTISIGIQSRSPVAAFVVPVIYIGTYYFVKMLFSGFPH